MLVACFANFIS